MRFSTLSPFLGEAYFSCSGSPRDSIRRFAQLKKAAQFRADDVAVVQTRRTQLLDVPGTENLRGQRQRDRGIDDGVPHLIAEAALRADSLVEEALDEFPTSGFLGGPIGMDRRAEQAPVEP